MNAMLPRFGARSPPRPTQRLMALSLKGVINTHKTHVTLLVKEYALWD